MATMDLTLNELCRIINQEDGKEQAEKLLDENATIVGHAGEITRVLKLKDAVVSEFNMFLEVRKLRDILQMTIHDDDVFVCSFPKTGTNWLCNMINYMLLSGPLDDGDNYPMLLVDLQHPDGITNAPRPRVLCCHRRPHQLPEQLLAKKKKVFLLYRNPKDTCVSRFHHTRRIGYKCSWDGFVDGWLNGLIPLDDYFDYYEAWQKEIQQTKNLDVLLVKYEHLKRDCLSELRRVQEFLGLSHSDQHLQTIVDKCSIDSMRTQAETSQTKSLWLDENGKSMIFRKGIVGDWKSHFTVAQNEQMDKWINENKHRVSMLRFNE